MAKDKELINMNDKKSIEKFLDQPSGKIAEFLTGILSSDFTALKLSAGKLIQACLKRDLFTQLGREIEEYRKKGEIKENYYSTNKNQFSLREMLKFIDEEVPDEERFKAMKSIFLTSVSKDASGKDEELAYEFMQICKRLSSGDLLVLKAAYDKKNGNTNLKRSIDDVRQATEWCHLISLQIGHGIPSLAEAYEEKLIELKLIGDRRHSDRSGFTEEKNFRLTGLGYKLCEFIVKYK